MRLQLASSAQYCFRCCPVSFAAILACAGSDERRPGDLDHTRLIASIRKSRHIVSDTQTGKWLVPSALTPRTQRKEQAPDAGAQPQWARS